MSYKLNSIYIIDTYKILYKAPYYDDDSDKYLQNIYYSFNGLMLISSQDNKYIDVLNDNEITSFCEDLKQGDIFLGNSYPLSLLEFVTSDINDIDLDKDKLLQIHNALIPVLEDSVSLLREDVYMFTSLFNLKGRVLKEYYNDHDNGNYYDERKEFIKRIIYNNIYRNNMKGE